MIMNGNAISINGITVTVANTVYTYNGLMALPANIDAAINTYQTTIDGRVNVRDYLMQKGYSSSDITISNGVVYLKGTALQLDVMMAGGTAYAYSSAIDSAINTYKQQSGEINLPSNGSSVEVIAGSQNGLAIMNSGTPYISFEDFALKIGAFPGPLDYDGNITWKFPNNIQVTYNTVKVITNGEYSDGLIKVTYSNGITENLYYYPQKDGNKYDAMIDVRKIAELSGYKDSTYITKDESGKCVIIILVPSIKLVEVDNSTLGSMTVNFIEGLWESLVDTVKGLGALPSLPAQLVQAIEFIVKACIPDSDESKALNEILTKMYYDFAVNMSTGDGRAKLAGKTVGTILIGLLVDKGLNVAMDALKACAKAGKLGPIANDVLNGGSKTVAVKAVQTVAEALGRKSIRVLDTIADSGIANRVKEIRSLLPSDLRRGGNFARANVEISGLKSEFYAHSGIDIIADARSAADAVADISLKPTNPVFQATEELTANGVPLLRDVDTEYKILNDIAAQLGNNTNITGKIRLFTELAPCPSCDNVILEFLKKYKNITIEVIHNDGTRLIP